jgi:hypothetical protein
MMRGTTITAVKYYIHASYGINSYWDLSRTSHAMGLYADELDYYDTGFPLESVYTSGIALKYCYFISLWNRNIIRIIYLSNAVLEGVSSSSELAKILKNLTKRRSPFLLSTIPFLFE